MRFLPVDILTSSVVSPPSNQLPLYPSQPRGPSVTRTQTVEFAPPPQPRGRHQTKLSVDRGIKRQISVAESRVQPSPTDEESTNVEVASKSSRTAGCKTQLIFPAGSGTFTQPVTTHPHRPSVPNIRRGMGGFPMPHEIISSIVHKFFPNLGRRIKRTFTSPVTRTLTSQRVEGGQQPVGSRPAPYITFDAPVGRNSTFHDLTHEQMEELCGVEFKALNCLVWIVPCVCFGHSSPHSLLIPIMDRVIVLLDHPGHLVHYRCTIYVSSDVGGSLYSSQPACQSFTSVVRVSQ